ncbi:hypothetical protein JOB18_017721 [Solea senegalensis]|uniref:Uncharacterized protein n=1 Tax=Solea senegalensis TaxID=28829 RepID=A0AAV6Q8B4_SOLSE|nr:hypothetical protein JOB18_017721 [Solea senegalensis]
MLKVMFVLGCLLSLALAKPAGEKHRRHGRPHFGSNLPRCPPHHGSPSFPPCQFQSRLLNCMQAIGVKLVALTVIMMLVSSSLAKPTHVIEKRSSEEKTSSTSTSSSSTISFKDLTEIIKILQLLQQLQAS